MEEKAFTFENEEKDGCRKYHIHPAVSKEKLAALPYVEHVIVGYITPRIIGVYLSPCFSPRQEVIEALETWMSNQLNPQREVYGILDLRKIYMPGE